MWFKNLRLYRLADTFSTTAADLEKAVGQSRFEHCSGQNTSSSGFVSPFGHRSESLVFSGQQQLIVTARFEKKVIPPSVITDETQKVLDAEEQQTGRKPKKSDRARAREAVLGKLIPQAFAIHSDVSVWIDLDQHLVIVDTSSSKKAEDTLSLLRKALGSLPVQPAETKDSVSTALTNWVLEGGSTVEGVMVTNEVTLSGTGDDNAVISAKKQDLFTDAIANLVKNDKVVTKLGLSCKDGEMEFVLEDDFSIKRLKIADELKNGGDTDAGNEDPVVRATTDYTIMTGLLSKTISDLAGAFGGIKPFSENGD